MITAVVLSKNEEKNIRDCLKSLESLNEILVIDDGSTDKTIEIAKSMNANVVIHKLEDDWASQRNFALTMVREEWVLFVDADERVSRELMEEIKETVKSNENATGFFLKRQDYFLKTILKHGETASVKILRLARRGSGKWEGPVHETWKVKGATGTLRNPLFHYPHPTIHEFLEEINRYSSIRARELYGEKTKVPAWQIVSYPVAKFIQNYLFKLGFLDKEAGFVMAMMMSIHSFLVRAKLYLYYKGVKEDDNK